MWVSFHNINIYVWYTMRQWYNYLLMLDLEVGSLANFVCLWKQQWVRGCKYLGNLIPQITLTYCTSPAKTHENCGHTLSTNLGTDLRAWYFYKEHLAIGYLCIELKLRSFSFVLSYDCYQTYLYRSDKCCPVTDLPRARLEVTEATQLGKHTLVSDIAA